MRPVWRMPASGDASFATTSLVGCPICPEQVPAGCCGWSNLSEVLGTNDPRFDHAGTRVIWMQQHPDVTATFGDTPLNPWRQVMRELAAPSQHDVPASGLAATSSVTFGQWRDDDEELVYWAIEAEGVAAKYRLYRMQPDGAGRTQVPLPLELCPSHPSYFADDEIIFTAWRCTDVYCSCDPGAP